MYIHYCKCKTYKPNIQGLKAGIFDLEFLSLKKIIWPRTSLPSWVFNSRSYNSRGYSGDVRLDVHGPGRVKGGTGERVS